MRQGLLFQNIVKCLGVHLGIVFAAKAKRICAGGIAAL